jgi:UDP-4-amino-4,6-dideoxy-N-acetyl-beta-L-altrosamine transaminase
VIPYGRQLISEADIAAVERVLRSDFLTQGPAIGSFEAAFAEVVQAKHAVACNSATSALHIACLALTVGKGQTVWTSPNSFVASANCALYCGASVDFVDIDPETLCMDAGLLASKLALHRAKGLALPSVVIPVHFGGQSCDMEAIHMLAQEFGFRVIEDASHAVGTLYQNKPVGDCRFSDICVFSFHPVKIITTGEGGMLTTQNPLLARRLQQLRSHGITREAAEMHQLPDGPWYYEQIALGLNYRMTDIQAALGASQLSRLTQFLERRREVASHYETEFNGFVGMQACPNYTESARHLFPIRVPAGKRRIIFDALRHAGLGINVHYIPIYLQPHYRALSFPQGLCPNAEAYYQEAISLPMHAGLTDSELAKVVDAVKNCMNSR